MSSSLFFIENEFTIVIFEFFVTANIKILKMLLALIVSCFACVHVPDEPETDKMATRRAGAGLRGLILTAALFSGMANILALTSPLFMLEIYDRVIPTRSVPTTPVPARPR